MAVALRVWQPVLLPLTGVRTIELRAAEWQEFDLENALWTIPSKAG